TGFTVISGFVSGDLRRRMVQGEHYDFPVGYPNLNSYDPTKHRRITFEIITQTGTTDLTVNFNPPVPDVCTGSLTVAENGEPFSQLHPEGFWNTVASNTNTTNYNERLYIYGFSGLSDNLFFTLKRPSGSMLCSQWNNFGLPVPPTNADGRIVNSGWGYAKRMGHSSFSEHAIGIVANNPYPLPVELSRFEVIPQENEVQIEWATASEQNCDYFAIERSRDEVNFHTLTSVSGNGTTSEPHFYQATDKRPFPGRSWYRLRQVDLDGTIHYSETKEVLFRMDKFRIYPNPVESRIALKVIPGNSFVNSDVEVKVWDIQGNLVWKQTTAYVSPFQEILVPTGLLKIGLYLVEVSNESLSQTKRLVVE
ncbi:MAG: T9SS type A sorting domain-containing protein, partial [Bacteroidia bacterium]|nr:T9SS type A sorting domain-containing protein [Bacteroidia bacterium]